MDLLEELQSQIIPGDGATGALLMEMGLPPDRCFEELCVSQPGMICDIHKRYIAAGARVIETNSFGANAVRLEKHGLQNRVGEINGAAARLAKQCARGKEVHVAGSIGPLGITAEQAGKRGINRENVFREQICSLLDGGVDLIFFETFLDPGEMALALRVKQSLHNCPVICSQTFSKRVSLPQGITPGDAFGGLRALGADIIGVNCMDPQAMLHLFGEIPSEGLLCAYPSAGNPAYRNGRFHYNITPDDFARSALELAKQGARLIGGCCGIGPEHIAAMAGAIRELAPSSKKSIRVSSLPSTRMTPC